MGAKVQTIGFGATERRIKAANRVAIAAAARAWHQTMMPIHFTPGGATKYHYAPRTVQYMRRKARRKKHQKPLRWSGESEDAAKTDFRITVRAMGEHVAGIVAMQMPIHFFQHPNSGRSFIDKPDELTRITPDEEQTLGDIYAATFAHELGIGSMSRTA